MIPHNFNYYRPESAAEAANLYQEFSQKGLSPLYYAGGTEVVTYARKQLIAPDALIDIKTIPRCREHGEKAGELVFGSALTLNEIEEEALYPLLSHAVSKIADHTVRNQLTLGGNICGRLPFREGLLPFLITECKVLIMSAERMELVEKPITEVFERRIKLSPGDFIVQFKVSAEAAQKPFASVRKVKQGDIAYPLLHAVALSEPEAHEQIRWAFSNVCPFPFRSEEVDAFINRQTQDQSSINMEDLEALTDYLPTKIADDLQAGSEYRAFKLKQAVKDGLAMVRGGRA